jgi:ketosteroid isomerase-like protein
VGVEENKEVALSFFERLSAGDIDGALDLIDEKVTWWLAGKPDQFEIAGSKTKAQLAEMLRSIETGMPEGIRLTITGVTAEGDRVAVEMNADGISVTGLQYQNQYHDLLEIRGGRIVAGREYLDTAHAAKVIVGSANAVSSPVGAPVV